LKTAFNVLVIGPPGVGKTHLAVALGLKAASVRKRALFCTAEDLTNELIAAEMSKRLALFFRVITKRYEKGSVIVTSNRPFEEWGNIFGDDVVAAAILDRLLYHSYPFLIQGKSYRMKEIFGHKKLEKKAPVE
jgi:DNA replication protein DnaC